MRTAGRFILLLYAFLFLAALTLGAASNEKEKRPHPREVIRSAVRQLLLMQEDTGRWSYESIPRDEEERDGLPFGFQVGGTSIVATTLLFAAPDDQEARAAVDRAATFVLKQLNHPKMAPLITEDAFDYRIWGHAFALNFLCHVRACKRVDRQAKEVDLAIAHLVDATLKEEFPEGGWGYAGRKRQQQSFVTASVVQGLLLARSQGENVPDKRLARCRRVLEAARMEDGAFVYAKSANDPKVRKHTSSTLAGSASRSLVCETTLLLLGGGSVQAVQFALENFYDHWDDLEKRRQQSGAHEGPYYIAPYYFYYGHCYAAQAIEMLPEKSRVKERERLLKTLLKTRDEDETWNDCEFERDHNVGTAFVVMALLGGQMPLPPKWKERN